MAGQRPLKVDLCGSGLGGIAAAIAIARAGCDVTLLEAAADLGEIEAGIQMTPNVSRLLINWGVERIIGDNLVQCKEINIRRKDGKVVRRTELVPKTVREFGFPWCVVRRDHLHEGLAEAARRHGVKIHVGSRVASVPHSTSPVRVRTERGVEYTIDLLADLVPGCQASSPANNAAYRAVLPYEEVWQKVPETKEFGNSIDVWMIEKGHIITYPILAGREWNAVLSHYRDVPVEDIEDNVDMQKVRKYYQDVDPRIRNVLDLIPTSRRWPLLITGSLESWSNEQKNVVLMGDAAHAMVNYLAQGAATSMEDGAFLGRVLAEVVRGVLSLPEAIQLYEKTRMPRAWFKQQASFVEGAVYMSDRRRAEARNASSVASLGRTSAQGEVVGLNSEPRISETDANARSFDLLGAPETVQSIIRMMLRATRITPSSPI